MNTIYLIIDRYEHSEFYCIFGKGIYTNEVEARKDYATELIKFKKFGPDDCHTFSLFKCTISDGDLEKLKEYYANYQADDDFAYDPNFIEFMDHLTDAGTELEFWTL